MATERTLSIIKPDATRRNLTGKVNAKFEEAGLRIVAQKRLQLSQEQAERFYAVHKARPFFGELTQFMASGPVVVQVLEGEGAVLKNREIMGATNPKDAAPGTIRAEFAESVGENSVHGSDAPETAAEEIAFFFSGLELVGRVHPSPRAPKARVPPDAGLSRSGAAQDSLGKGREHSPSCPVRWANRSAREGIMATNQETSRLPRGFAAMDPEKQRAIASKGGKVSGGNFRNDPARAAQAGRKGGEASGGNFAHDPARAAQAGRKGGQA